MGAALDYYYNKSKIWLPMKAENHDPSNTTGTELITDGDMEAETTAAWIPGGATLSKETVGAHSGTRWLKVTTGAVQYAYQILFTVGAKYRVTGWAKGDGSSFPQVYSGTSWWTGSTSTSWEYFDITFIAGETRLRFYATGAGFTGFDDVTVEALESRTLDVSGYGNHAILGDGATPATMPTKLQKRGYSFDGSSDYLQTPWVPTASGTLAVLFNTANSNASPLMGSYNISSDRCYLWISAGVLKGGIAGQSLATIIGTTPIKEQQHYFASITWDGTTVRLILDTNIEYSAAQVGVFSDAIPILVGGIDTGGGLGYHNGNIFWTSTFNQALTMPQLNDLRVKLLAEVNHV